MKPILQSDNIGFCHKGAVLRWAAIGWVLFVSIFIFLAVFNESNLYRQSRDAAYYYDTKSSETIENVINAEFAPIRGYVRPKSHIIWIKIPVPEVVANDLIPQILFTGSNETVLSMEAFGVEGQLIERLGNCNVQLSALSCDYPNLQYAFPIKKTLKAPNAIYLKTETHGMPIQNEFYFMPKPYYNRATSFLTYMIGFSSGIFVLIAGVGFLAYAAVRKRSYLVFVLYCFASFCSTIIYRGIWDAIRPSEAVPFAGSLFALVFFAARTFELLFVKEFFETKIHYKRINALYLVMLFTYAVVGIGTIFSLAEGSAWTVWTWTVFLAPAIIVCTLIYFVYKRHKWAPTFAMAWSLGMLSYAMWAVYHFGILSDHWFFGYLPLYARPIQMFIFTYIIIQTWRANMIELGEAKVRNRDANIISTLFRTLSHDLSNTTQVITLRTGHALESIPPGPQRTNLERIKNAIEAQADIIRNVKKGFQIRGTKSVVELSNVELNEIVDKSLGLFSEVLGKKGIELVRENPKDEIYISAEPISLQHQIISNVLSNAIKFTGRGRKIFVRTGNEDFATAFLEIRDEGSGMSDTTKHDLFSRKKDISRPGTLEEEGTGHGLLIVKDFIDAFGGRIDVSSTEGKGSTFTLRFRRVT